MFLLAILCAAPGWHIFFSCISYEIFFVLNPMKCISLHCIVCPGDRYLTQEAFVSPISY